MINRTAIALTAAIVLLTAGATMAADGDPAEAAAEAAAAAQAKMDAARADSMAAARQMQVGKVLLQRCAQCHGEGRPAAGVSLEWVDFPQSLINVRSSQVDTLFLVEPGSPDRSYLVWKLEGHEDIFGNRMPTGPKGLPEGQLLMVRHWIEELPEPAPADTSATKEQ